MEQRIPANALEKNLLTNINNIYQLLGEGTPQAVEKILKLIKNPNQIGVFKLSGNNKKFELTGNFFAFALACEYTTADTIKYLIRHSKFRCDIPFDIKQDNQKHTYHPLRYCLGHGYLDKVKVFLEEPNLDLNNIKISMDFKDVNGTMVQKLDVPIIYAFLNQELAIFEQAIAKYKGTSIIESYTALNLITEIIAAYQKDENTCVRYLEAVLSAYKDPAKLINNAAPINGIGNSFPPLLFATELGLTKVIDLLAAKPGVKLNPEWKYENLATAAVINGNLAVLQHLHEKGYINPKKIGRALHIACLQRKLDHINFLIEQGYHLHAPNQAGLELRRHLSDQSGFQTNTETALQIAIALNHLDIAYTLVEKGKIDINETDGLYKRSAIFVAIEYNHYEALAWLIEKKADVNLSDKDGITPLLLAIQCANNVSAINQIIAASANLNAEDDFKRTPLIMASMYIKQEFIECLLLKGNVDLYAKDWHGFTAFDYALITDHAEILAILLKAIIEPKKKQAILLHLSYLIIFLPNNINTQILLKTELGDKFEAIQHAYSQISQLHKEIKDSINDLLSSLRYIQKTITNKQLSAKTKPNVHDEINFNKSSTHLSTFFPEKPLKRYQLSSESQQDLSNQAKEIEELFKNRTWFNGIFDTNDSRNLLKKIRKTFNCYLYLPEELLREQAKQQNYTNIDRLEALFNEPYPKFYHSLGSNNDYQIHVQVGQYQFTANLTQEIYVEGKARILVFAAPDDYNDEKSQRATLYMGIFSKNGLHSQADINNLLASNKVIKITLPDAKQNEEKNNFSIKPRNI